VLVETIREAHRPGVWGRVDDDLAFLSPWGFEVTEIQGPVTIRYGRQDVMVPAAHGAWLAGHVPGAVVTVEDEAGHLVGPEVFLERITVLADQVRHDSPSTS
jgi:pimeloyl-ACP methyl ester carboxylesterase